MKTFKFIRLIMALFAIMPIAFGQQYIRNISLRTPVSTGDDVAIIGFVIREVPGAPFGAKKTMLLRGVGPTLALAPFDIQNANQNPRIALYKGSTLITANEGWNGSAQLQMAAQQVGAFPLAIGSKDAVIFADLEAGAYTVILTGTGGGTALFEAYDSSRDTNRTRIVNISARARSVGDGAQSVIAGIVVDGNSPQPLLVRVAGPELSGFGLSSVLPDPTLTVFNNRGVVVASNNDWGGGTTLTNAFSQVGAFPWQANSKGSALVFTPGTGTVSYTFRGGQANTSGVIVIEAYQM